MSIDDAVAAVDAAEDVVAVVVKLLLAGPLVRWFSFLRLLVHVHLQTAMILLRSLRIVVMLTPTTIDFALAQRIIVSTEMMNLH